MKITTLRELTEKRNKLLEEQYEILNKAEQNMPEEVAFSFNIQKMLAHDSNESLEEVEKEFLPESDKKTAKEFLNLK